AVTTSFEPAGTSPPSAQRLDVYVKCGSAYFPAATNVAPSSVSGQTASFDTGQIDSVGICDNGVVYTVANDGFSRSAVVAANPSVDLYSAPLPPTAAIVSPGD